MDQKSDRLLIGPDAVSIFDKKTGVFLITINFKLISVSTMNIDKISMPGEQPMNLVDMDRETLIKKHPILENRRGL